MICVRALGRGEKGPWREPVCQGLAERGLIAFDGHHEVAALLIEDWLGGRDLRMQGLDQDGPARQIEWSEPLPRGRDFMALGRGADASEEAARAADRVDPFHAARPPLLAVADDPPIRQRPGQTAPASAGAVVPARRPPPR
jgi:hypothetical protein